ncbi:MAG: S41 family peptidase [Salinivirgaceae bacterium]|nr:S41 family peptidase [Salinivirgaceae bacterium]
MIRKILVSTFIIILAFSFTANCQLFNDDVYKFSKVVSFIDSYYVDSVQKDKLVEKAIIAMLKELDPHSVYISKEDVEKMNEPLQGSFEGVGIQFNIMNDTLLVVSPISGGPSEKVGILAGDRIVRIDTQMVAGIGLTNEMVFDKLRGKKGTKVILEIVRRGEKEILDFEVIRDKIPIFSLDAAYVVDKKQKVGYIKLNRFAATTMKEYEEAIDKLKSNGVENLILDLTDNGGGYLNMAQELADEFLKQGQLIVYTEGLHNPKNDLLATKTGNSEVGKVVIMIDEGSASASEIVSGAIQDWDRGVIVGRRSFGKGLVQRPINLPDQSMMRLTIARYYTPTGRLIQKSYENGTKDYHKDLINRYNNGELSNEDSIHFPDSLQYKTLLNKRIVYGGGGIMPDIFVPIDTTTYSDYYRDLIRKGIINRYILKYMDVHRTELEKQYKVDKKNHDFDAFVNDYKITDEFLSNLIEYAKEQKLEFNEEEYNKSLEHLKINLKALIARDVWSTSEFFQIVNEVDPIYNQAVKVMLNDELYQSKLLP